MSLWILRVYLKAGPVVELIYNGADACRRSVKVLEAPELTAISDDYGKAITVEVDEIAALMTSDYDAELAGVDNIERAKAGLRAKLQQRAAAQARLIGGGRPLAQGFKGGMLAP